MMGRVFSFGFKGWYQWKDKIRWHMV